MSKYYVLAESPSGRWSVYNRRYESNQWYTQHDKISTCAEKNMRSSFLNNTGDWYYSDSIRAKMREVMFNTNLSYKEAIDFVKKAEHYQEAELKHVKAKYVNQHTIKFSVISEDRALKLIKELPVKQYKHENEPVRLKPHSLEGRRWIKSFENKKTIWKD